MHQILISIFNIIIKSNEGLSHMVDKIPPPGPNLGFLLQYSLSRIFTMVYEVCHSLALNSQFLIL